MKKFLLALAACIGLSGCVEERVYYPEGYSTGSVEFCDDYGCRWVNGPYYYDSAGALFYWDVHFGVWMGPHGYWHGGAYYHGGYYHYSHPGHYHYTPSHGGYRRR